MVEKANIFLMSVCVRGKKAALAAVMTNQGNDQ